MAAKPQVKVVSVGRLREPFWRDAQAEYQKRLGAYTTRLEVAEVADEPTPEDASPAQEVAIRQKEAERLLTRIGEREYVIALDSSRGKAFTSPEFAAHLERCFAEGGQSALTFVIGGSLGLHQSLLTRADLIVTFGAFTFPHQLMRVLLLEQLYRAFKIQRSEPYHK
ncbi:MAG: 23S rRNA (pseudouridine(1915)-N(3))-methyltransferase RlmH [Cytophagales bacterium]|nr:23S rRNA (pseudouridine(1915)-N(3))-methyltransferase RlmH [Armatimonadota bacterium]